MFEGKSLNHSASSKEQKVEWQQLCISGLSLRASLCWFRAVSVQILRLSRFGENLGGKSGWTEWVSPTICE